MKPWLPLVPWLVFQVVARPAAINPDVKIDESREPEIAIPAELTGETFDLFTGDNLAFVEFYSPYCSHCKHLAPVWAKTYRQTAEEQESLKIHMRQVNCVESADLCEREGITTYPNLRLYSPQKDKEGQKTGKSRFVSSFPHYLDRTPEDFKKFMLNSVAEYNAGAVDIPSSSQEMDVDLGMRVVAGEMPEPWLVALFPTNRDDYDKNHFQRTCLNCLEEKQAWDKLSNLIMSHSKSGHLLCHAEDVMCEQLGFPELGTQSISQSPKYVMFLPKETGIQRFDYTGIIDLQEMKNWAIKLAASSKYEEGTARDFEDFGLLLPELPPMPVDLNFPLTNEMALVFVYDNKKVSKEDKAIMPYLLEMTTKVPFKIQIFASKSKKFQAALDEQALGFYKYINADALFPKMEYDKLMQQATTLTAVPTLYLLKSNSLVPAVYQNFAIEDMRKPEKIEKWLLKNMYPMYGELTPGLMGWYFDQRSKNKAGDKVVITFIDSSDASTIADQLFKISVAAHQYTAIKKEYYYKDLLQKRDQKKERVEKLKAKNADTVAVIDEMKMAIPHLFDHDDVLFTYIDLHANPDLAEIAGFNIDGGEIKAGDVIVVSKNLQDYWDSSLSGEKLVNDPQQVRKVLLYLLDPALVGNLPVHNFSAKLVGSPFSKSFRFLDYVHRKGFLGYFILSTLAFVLFAIWRSRRVKPRASYGIIANPAKAD